jgi:hypothetical protein
MKPTLAAAFFSIVLMTACTKERSLPAPTPSPVVQNPRLAIKLNQDYMPANKIDSAVLTWELNGQLQQKRMELSNDTLFAETKSLNKGAGRATVQIFSRTSLRQQNLQWEKRADLTLNDNSSVNWSAPANYEDATWFPRVIFVDAPTKFTVIIALRPTDPYFFLKNVPPGFKIELERNYTKIPGGAEIVGGGTWKCNGVCTDSRGIIENREFFRPLATQMAGREWKMVEVGVGLFGDNYTSGPGFYFNYW